ncbi:MAG TPA: bifunctional hydroxymethylpyrimidine kinase/phosphomethylpyrimidine kinase [Pyrinomonadaceae bacterium]|nr:bifunctional hydroxymethylpyrimidine kinase/phosphomethylpyrimidine kinase [Pyrinomonadaceae bacterium]
MSNGNPPPVALSIAGVDPSGGAGILADVRTFAAFGCFPTAVITSLTFQNTTGVLGVSHQTAQVIRDQTLPLIADFRISGAKTGMLPNAEVIEEVARLFSDLPLPAPVVDPVMQATSGDSLIDDKAVETLVQKLFPLARLVTPNIPEAERLTGILLTDVGKMTEAARQIRALGAPSVLLKGGHLGGNEAIDVLDCEGTVSVLRSEKSHFGPVHGSGCTLSAAIAAGLAHGLQLPDSVARAKEYVTKLIRESPAIGHGARPLFSVEPTFNPRS